MKAIYRIAQLESFVRLEAMTDEKEEECIRTILVSKKLIAHLVFQDIGKTLSFTNNLQKYRMYFRERCLSVYWSSAALTLDHFFFAMHTSLPTSYF